MLRALRDFGSRRSGARRGRHRRGASCSHQGSVRGHADRALPAGSTQWREVPSLQVTETARRVPALLALKYRRRGRNRGPPPQPRSAAAAAGATASAEVFAPVSYETGGRRRYAITSSPAVATRFRYANRSPILPYRPVGSISATSSSSAVGGVSGTSSGSTEGPLR